MVSLWYLPRPLEGHLPQGTELHLSIDEGSPEMAMTDYIGDFLQRMALVEHSGGKAMPKGMCAPAWDLDACGPDATFNDG